MMYPPGRLIRLSVLYSGKDCISLKSGDVLNDTIRYAAAVTGEGCKNLD